MVTIEYVNGQISIKLMGQKLSVLKKEIHLTQKHLKSSVQNGVSQNVLTTEYNISSKSSSIITIEHREIISIWQKERKQRKKNAWKSFCTVSIMIAIIKKQP